MEQLNNKGCEEVEIQFIDGDNHTLHISLAKAASIGYLLDLGHSLDEAFTRYDEVSIYHGSSVDYAQELIEDTTEIPESLPILYPS